MHQHSMYCSTLCNHALASGCTTVSTLPLGRLCCCCCSSFQLEEPAGPVLLSSHCHGHLLTIFKLSCASWSDAIPAHCQHPQHHPSVCVVHSVGALQSMVVAPLKFTGLLQVLLEGTLLLLATAPEVPPTEEQQQLQLWDAMKSACTAGSYMTMALGAS